jgi:hypothetical protein
MDWSTPIDLYCERTDASFWAEPANAATNAAFLFAAALALVEWRRAGARASRPDSTHDWPTLILIMVVAAVGVGSFIFHTIATRGAVFADVIPIAIFIYGYLLLALVRFLRASPPMAIAVTVAYATATQALPWLVPSRALNGSVAYLPALVALIAVARLTRGPARRGLNLAVMLFTVSLALRTIDLEACEAFPLGTHFVWHLFNAVVLYVLLHTAITAKIKAVTEPGSETAASVHRGSS